VIPPLAMNWSKSSIDELGNRLRGASVTSNDLELLDEYRLGFAKACTHVAQILQERFQTVTTRPAKSTRSILEKLRRESIRFSQMQDVAGCRVIVEGVRTQDDAVQGISSAFETRSVFDRRNVPSSGYRAVHLVVISQGRSVEVQVRTHLQHAWAEVSERLSDTVDPRIKYGGGPASVRELLERYSKLVAEFESFEPPYEHPAEESSSASNLVEVKKAIGAQIEALKKILLTQGGGD
jgi:putative GTP pyrophosphokinase